MKSLYKRMASAIALLLWSAVYVMGQAPESTVTWKISQSPAKDGICEIVFEGTIAQGWHTYSIDHEFTPTEVTFTDPEGYSAEGGLYEITPSEEVDGEHVYFDKIKIGQKIRLTAQADSLKGEIAWRSCNDQFCASPEYLTFSMKLDAQETAAPAAGSGAGESDGSLWGLILEAILWGFAMLLTPCVFPMIPMTISFFMKGSSSPAAGRFKAFMYGLFIVLLYTVPISAIIGITYIFGGETVTADIFNWLATHWLPNIIFFIVFMIFAASFFGAFEITLPSSLVNKSDKNSDKGGLAGIFFMALTLVLVSFSCTGPIVGSVLIKSTQGEFWTPMVTMLAFSVAFALPFTILAMFPSLLKKLKSGSWLNSVKVVLGFIEVALGFKFLSVADQTYHWGLLDREIYLGIWIVVFTLLGLYLLGKIRFEADSEVKHIGVFRLMLVIINFTFVVYMIPGMFGAPLKALSGYLPPIETQDFVIWSKGDGGMQVSGTAQTEENTDTEGLHSLPLGLRGYYSLDEAMAASRETGKPVFVDISGLACVNCREMEQRVWSDTAVLSMLKNDFVIAVLYTDDKAKLPEDEWITTKTGKVLKERGRVNAYYAREAFNVSAQPNYVILDSDGNELSPVRGYNLDIAEYIQFLQGGLDKFAKNSL